MKVVILAGGYGTRLSEYTKTIPKPMVMIKNKPLIYYSILTALSSKYISKCVVTTDSKKIAKIAKIAGRTMESKSGGPNGGIRKGCCVRCERKRMSHQTTRSFPNTAPPPTTQNRLSSPSSIVSIAPFAPSLPSDPPPKSNTPLAYHNRSVACAKWVGCSLCHRVRVGSSTRQHRYA